MNNIALLISVGSIALFFSCKKNEDSQPQVNPVPVATVDDIVGTYTGQQTHHKIDYAYGMGQTYLRDTVFYTTDTIIVEKIDKDSFTFADPGKWAVYSKPLRFAFDTANLYTLKYQGSGGSKDTVTIRFDMATDSMAVAKYDLSPGTSAYHIYAFTFRGKK